MITNETIAGQSNHHISGFIQKVPPPKGFVRAGTLSSMLLTWNAALARGAPVASSVSATLSLCVFVGGKP